ncbi:ComEC/Rec2 family competence protein [Sulfurovum sp.]|uniref:ComEC/Rec2 family competence protein n=1 Tax=Sulfurovum sp. TaxID=1969726 RepID=UPI0025E0E7F8|nr:ComEC/Rec2 family competence protein [Sulfurovum sp.]
MEKPKLFESTKSFVWTIAVLVIFLLVRLFFEYQSYQNFTSKPFYYTYAKVLTAYKKSKNGRAYQVLKLHGEDGSFFYTTTHRKNDFSYKRLRLQLFPNKDISFKDYLGTFYVKSRIKKVQNLPKTFKDALLGKVASQHKDLSLQSFYNAIFFATPIAKTLREKISMLGISHLVALSGFHLGILWGLVYGLLLLVYRPIQQKHFPYRHALFDVGLVAMIFLGAYLWFVDFPPSLVRSYAMVLVGWVVLLLGIELLSFTFLTTILLTLIVLFPALLVSLSFWLSVAGVFYIFLLLQYAKTFNKWMITLLFIPLGIFTLMLPVVHSIFGVTSTYQLLSPLLSLLFIPFYPMVILLHLLGMGDLLDAGLQWLFSLPQGNEDKFLPLWAMLGYVALSIGAIWQRKLFYVVFGLAFGYSGYLFL